MLVNMGVHAYMRTCACVSVLGIEGSGLGHV